MDRTSWHYRMKAEHKCTKCSKPLPDKWTKTLCPECNEKNNAYTAESRKWYVAHGICPKCHRQPILGSEKACPECRAKDAEHAARRKAKNPELVAEKMNKAHKSIYEKRKAMGICPMCGARKPVKGVLCELCKAKCRTRKARCTPPPHPREERPERGVCYFCDNPIMSGYKVCEKHYEMNLEKLKHPKVIEYRKQFSYGKREVKQCVKY